MVQFKRAVSLLLTLCLMVALLPAKALAVGMGGPEVEPPPVEDGYNTMTLADESAGVKQSTKVGTGSSSDELTTGDSEMPISSASVNESLQPVGELQSVDGAVSGQRDHADIVETGDSNTVPTPTVEQDIEPSVGKEEATVTRIAWIHELAVRFYTRPEDYTDFTDVVFSDYSQSEEFYRDAVWAWNVGLFENNEEMSIRPFDSATREFTAYTLTSCLDLGLGDGEASTTYAMENNKTLSEESQIALNRGWFNEDNVSLDADVEYDEVGVMLSDAEGIVALGEVEEGYANTYQFADGVIEIPEDIGFEISQDETAVTLYSDALSIEAGDNFVVYLDSLPIAYTALAVARENDNTTISVKKAETTVFEYVDAQGIIPLTAENSEFIPADGVELMSASTRDGLDYSNGKLSLSTSLGDSKAEVYLENLRLNHSFSDDGFTVTVSGTWGLGSTLAYKEEAVSEIPLGEVRIYGVGVIAVKLSLTMGMEMSGNFSGTFNAGASVLSDGTTRAIHEFSVSNCSVTGQGSLSAALKVSAGVDILVAQAIVYGEVGLKTQYTSQVKKNSNDVTIHCQDYKYYLFLTVGSDLNYFAFWNGKMETLVGKKFPLIDDTKGPFIQQWHWENGVRVGSCSMGMKVADLHFGGSTAITGGSLSIDSLDRVLETSVALPGDVIVSGDFTIENGSTLNLNGHTLTMQGNLFVNDGILSIGNGTLNVGGNLIVKKGCMTISGGTVNVDGNFRIQSVTEDANGETIYGETDAYISMQNGVLNVGGDFVTQSTKQTDLYIGDNHFSDMSTINLKGNFSQLAGAESNFVCRSKVVLCGTSQQTVTFVSYPSSKFTTLQLTQPMSNYVFTPNPCWDKLIEAGTITEITMPVLQKNGSTGTLTSQIFCPSSMDGKTVIGIAAFYDKQYRMLTIWVQGGFTLQNKMELAINGNLPNGYSTVKLFLLDSSTHAPLCEAKMVSIDG